MKVIRVIKKADDPMGIPRVSLGGGESIGGVYVVYRGRKEDAIACLEAAVVAMQELAAQLGSGEPDVSPDNGKRFA